jgi:hypothetical protein
MMILPDLLHFGRGKRLRVKWDGVTRDRRQATLSSNRSTAASVEPPKRWALFSASAIGAPNFSNAVQVRHGRAAVILPKSCGYDRHVVLLKIAVVSSPQGCVAAS